MHVYFWKIDVLSLANRCLPVFLAGVWNLGIQLKLSAIAYLAKLTKLVLTHFKGLSHYCC